MNYLPYVVFVVLIVGLLAFSARARRRQASAQAAQMDGITVGTDVMTTSGLHGTVVTVNDDDTVQLSIAPGVEVRWEMAALRDLASLPDRYRRDAGLPEGSGPTGDPDDTVTPGTREQDSPGGGMDLHKRDTP